MNSQFVAAYIILRTQKRNKEKNVFIRNDTLVLVYAILCAIRLK